MRYEIRSREGQTLAKFLRPGDACIAAEALRTVLRLSVRVVRPDGSTHAIYAHAGGAA